ncbi:sigma-70 family RNA polymerase sigma factor [Paracoccus aestuariivivens]|uniref:Sigma-70 family RNA polymerase sigma factor n=1 Tax=Paracoccus aestuariivivens TaxID=1820333 RepID=A0A6L6J6P4_9RHOB|nr:sigma-70 family RNA polymerase sigma factor [Paracoccus aestuariivivens]MTH76878.1 sigma-70 family RNA polymerase sigma factor [Paracoccus aestuariivivens]
MSRKPDPILDQLPALRRYALALSRDEGEADDLVQEALLRGHENRQGFRAGGNLRAWLFGILRNAFLDRLRKRRAESRREAAVAAFAPDSIDAPQDAAIRLAQLRQEFMQLPDEQREALSLVAIEGMSYADAAQLAEVPLGTLMSRVARARARLRDFEDGKQQAPALKLVGGRDATRK